MERTAARWRREGAAAVMVLDSPPLNVLTNQMRDDIAACLEEIRQEDAVRAVVITGAGQRAFMAGADIKGFPAMSKVPGAAYGYAKTIYDVWDAVARFDKPVIAALNGLTLGAGMELALACDLRVADEHARFGFPEIKLGLFPGGGGTQRMPRLAGLALTREMCFTGEPIDAQRAYAAGFLNYVVPRGRCLDQAMELAERIGRFSAPILSYAKQAVNGGVGVSLEEGLALEADLWQRAFMTDDLAEGVDAFLTKREPVFQHR